MGHEQIKLQVFYCVNVIYIQFSLLRGDVLEECSICTFVEKPLHGNE